MKLVKTTLLGAAGVVLALGLTAAHAQDYSGGEAGGPPAAGPDAAGGGAASGAPTGGAPETMTESPAGAGAESTAPERKPGAKAGKAVGQADKTGQDAAGKAAKEEKAGAKTESGTAGTAADTKDTMDKATTDKGEAKDSVDKTATEKGEAATEDKAGATADTKAGAEDADGKTAKVEPEQINKAKTYFRQNRPRVKAIDRSEISVSIGFALPGTIVLYDLPPDVIVVRGGCGIKYFLWGDDVVLVDSCTRRVVDIVALG